MACCGPSASTISASSQYARPLLFPPGLINKSSTFHPNLEAGSPHCCKNISVAQIAWSWRSRDKTISTLCVDPEWVLDWLVTALPITPPVRRRVLVPTLAWHLGDAHIGGTELAVVFGYGGERIYEARPRPALPAYRSLEGELETIAAKLAAADPSSSLPSPEGKSAVS